MNPDQLLEYVITPTLKYLDLWSPAAEVLLLGTCAQESAMGKYIHQIKGPALGIYQMEPVTHFDIWSNFIRYRPELSQKLLAMVPPTHLKKDSVTGVTYGSSNLLVNDLAYATAMSRVFYLRVKAPMPSADDLEGIAGYWKKYYNTNLGKGTVEEFKANYKKYVTNQ